MDEVVEDNGDVDDACVLAIFGFDLVDVVEVEFNNDRRDGVDGVEGEKDGGDDLDDYQIDDGGWWCR